MSTSLSAYQQACALIVGILSVGSLAIVICRKLRPQNETFQKVAIIIRSWWMIMAAFLIALAWRPWGLTLLMYVTSILATREYLKVSKVPYKNYLQVVFFIICTIQYATLAFQSLPLFLSSLPVLCLWIVPALVIFRATIAEIELITSVGVGFALIIYYLSHVAALSTLPSLNLTSDECIYAVFVLLLVTWCNDIFQFLSGKNFGHRKIVPNVSPNKTLGGFIGGIVGTLVLSSLCCPALLGISLAHSIVLGALLGATGMFGDLFFSAVKRNIGVKDFSRALPGHGGLLDRLDSLIFTAPIYFHYLLFLKG